MNSSYLKEIVDYDPINLTDLINFHITQQSACFKRFLMTGEIDATVLNHPIFVWGESSSNMLIELATGTTELIELALVRGCLPNLRDEGPYGNTPLVWSIANDAKETSIELIKQCKRHNIPLDLDKSSTFNGNTPLILCIAKGHKRPGQMPNYALTEYLIANGANVNKPDDLGNTPLHYACVRRDLETIRLLLANNADQNIENHLGQKPSDMLDLNIDQARTLVYSITDGEEQGSCSFDRNPQTFDQRTPEARMLLSGN